MSTTQSHFIPLHSARQQKLVDVMRINLYFSTRVIFHPKEVVPSATISLTNIKYYLGNFSIFTEIIFTRNDLLGGCESFLHNTTVYIYDLHQWQYVCNDQMTQHTADVICRENFDSSAVYYSYIPMSFTSYNFPIFGYTFDCTGNETSLCQCQYVANSCPNMEVAEVMCNRPGKELQISGVI